MESSSVDGNKDVSFPSGDLDQLFPLNSLSSDCGDLSPCVSTSKRSRQSPQPWSSQDLWELPQESGASAEPSSLSLNDTVHDTVHPSAVSDLSLNLDAPSSSSRPEAAHGLLSTSSSTPPQTPRKKLCTGSGVITPKSTRTQHRDTRDRRGLLRKQSFSPTLDRSTNAQKSKMVYSDAPSQRFHNFTFRNSDDRLPLSPPPSDMLVQQENLPAGSTAFNRSSDRLGGDSTEMSQQYDSSIFNQSPAISMPSPSANALARQQQKYMNQPNSSALTSSPPSADDIFSSPHSSGSQSLSSWYSDSLGTSAFSFTPDLNNHDTQAWWSPMASRVAQRQPSYQPMLASPAPQRPIQNPEHQNNMLQGGLMIQFDPSFDVSAPTEPSFAPSTISSSAPATTQEAQAYQPVTNTPQNLMHTSFATPQIENPHSSRSPSLSPKANSATTTTPLKPASSTATRTRPTNLRTPDRRSHDRKMSAPSNTPKPVKAPASAASTNRSSSGSSSSSPRGSNKSVSVSFVNFTPSDSKKILTGVAPSGSSKTKARREQEARDRRRKLSEAALKAVRTAGGDIDALEAVLC